MAKQKCYFIRAVKDEKPINDSPIESAHYETRLMVNAGSLMEAVDFATSYLSEGWDVTTAERNGGCISPL